MCTIYGPREPGHRRRVTTFALAGFAGFRLFGLDRLRMRSLCLKIRVERLGSRVGRGRGESTLYPGCGESLSPTFVSRAAHSLRRRVSHLSHPDSCVSRSSIINVVLQKNFVSPLKARTLVRGYDIDRSVLIREIHTVAVIEYIDTALYGFIPDPHAAESVSKRAR